MPAIFYLSLPPVEVAAATNRLTQPEQSRAVEPHPFDDSDRSRDVVATGPSPPAAPAPSAAAA